MLGRLGDSILDHARKLQTILLRPRADQYALQQDTFLRPRRAFTVMTPFQAAEFQQTSKRGMVGAPAKFCVTLEGTYA